MAEKDRAEELVPGMRRAVEIVGHEMSLAGHGGSVSDDLARAFRSLTNDLERLESGYIIERTRPRPSES